MVYILIFQFLTDSYIIHFIILHSASGQHVWPATHLIFSIIVSQAFSHVPAISQIIYANKNEHLSLELSSACSTALLTRNQPILDLLKNE